MSLKFRVEFWGLYKNFGFVNVYIVIEIMFIDVLMKFFRLGM